jgi:PadR family transcriptional regulator
MGTEKPNAGLLPGTLDMLVLKILMRGHLHGYAIAQLIQQLSDHLLRVEEGSLYPALRRIELNGWIEGEWGLSANNRRARFYRLTAEGRNHLTEESARYRSSPYVSEVTPAASLMTPLTTQRAARQMVGFREALVLSLAISLSACASMANGQVTAGNDGYSDDLARSAIQKAEQLRRAGELPEAYRVLSSVRNGQTGRTGAALMNCLGAVLQDLGRLDDAEQQYRQSLRMLERQFGPNDPDLVFALNNLGSLLMVRGRLSEAARLRERSLEMRERTYPPADPVVLRAIENLAAVRLAQKQYAEAQRLLERARKAWEELRPGAPEAAIALNGLGSVALRNKRKDQAAMFFREAIDRWQPDTEPLLLAQVLGNLATVLGPDEALAQYTRAVALVEKHGGPEHPLLAPLYDRQAACLRRLHRTRESRELAARARRVRQANPTGVSVDVSSLK